jgi:peroxiredoxin
VECHGESDPGREWVSRWRWSETDFGLDPKPLDPGKETEVVIRTPMPIRNSKFGQQPRGTCDNFHVIAAVFADGTVSGDLSWVNAIVNERRKVYQDIAKATEMLNKAVADKTDPSGVVKQFEEWWQDERPGRMAPAKTGYGEASGSSWQGAREGQPLVPKMPPRAGTSPRAAVPGVTLSLLQQEKTSLPDTIKMLAAWRERLGQIKAVTEAAGAASSADLPRRLRVALPPDPDLVGKPAPDFALKDVDSHQVTLKDLRGKSVLLTFWATWCEPCRNELPQIEALYEALKDKGLVVLAVNVNESAETAKKFFAEQGYTFQCLVDPAGEANKQYGAGGIPRTILIDKDGIVRDFHRGYGPKVDLRASVKKLGLE